jgi:hypothetical protein
MTSAIAVLTVAETDLLEQAEATIARGIKTFLEVGEALTQVRDNRLYRAEFATFEEYAEQRWGFTKTHANRLVSAASVAAILAPMGVEINSERQARELAPLLETPAEMRAAFTEAIERADGKPTAAVIREVVRERMDPASPLAQVAERELDKVEARPVVEPQPSFTPERVAEIEDYVQPAVQYGRLALVCRTFLEELAEVDLFAAARGMTDDNAKPVLEAIAQLALMCRVLEVEVN